MPIDLKTEAPDTTIPDGAFLFGADSQSAANPSVYPIASVTAKVVLSVKLFGAVGDGVADDTPAVLLAAAASGRTVVFPAGIYRLSAVDFGAVNVHFIGEGMGQSTILWAPGSPETSLLKFSGAAKVRIAHMTIDGNRQNQTDSTGYYGAVAHAGTNGAALTLDEVEFKNGRIHDVLVTGPTGSGESMSLVAKNCAFLDGFVGTAGRSAQAVAASEGVRVAFHFNRLIQPTAPASYGRAGLVVQRPASSTALSWATVNASKNYFENFGRGTANVLGCIYVYSGSESSVITDNIAKNSYGSAFCVKSDCGNAVVANNVVNGHVGATTPAIAMFDMADAYTSYIGRNLIVTGNVVRNAEFTGIYVDGNLTGTATKRKNILISHNVIDGGVRGVHLRAVDTAQVVHNTIAGTTGIAIYLDAIVGSCEVSQNTIQGGVIGISTLNDVTLMDLVAKDNILRGLSAVAIKLISSVAAFDLRDNKIDGCTGAFDLAGATGNAYVIGNTTRNSTYVLSKTGTYGALIWDRNITSQTLGFGSLRNQIIAAGVVTIFADWHSIDTEAAAATDDLDTINGGYEGRVLTLAATSSVRDVVLKDGTGNLRLAGDMTLDHVDDSISLMYRGSAWVETARSNNT